MSALIVSLYALSSKTVKLWESVIWSLKIKLNDEELEDGKMRGWVAPS